MTSVDYVYNASAYNFRISTTDVSDIQEILDGMPADLTQEGLGNQIYTKLLELIEDPNSDAIGTVDPDVVEWLQGAVGVNQDSTVQGKFIRAYTKEVYSIRYGTTTSDALLNTASNKIAINLAQSIITQHGLFPDIQGLGAIDAGFGAAQTVFNQSSDPSTGVYSPWAGTMLFPFLGTSSFYQNWLLNVGTVTGTVVDPITGSQDFETFKSVIGTYDLVSVLESLQSAGVAIWGALSDMAPSPGVTPTALADETQSFFTTYYGVSSSEVRGIGTGTPFDASSIITSPSYIATTLAGGTKIINNALYNVIASGAQGDDIFDVDQTGFGGSIIDGGAGYNTADYTGWVGGYSLDFKLQVSASSSFSYRFSVENDFLYDIEKIIGNSQGDELDISSESVGFWQNITQSLSVDLGSDIAANKIALDGSQTAGDNYFSVASGSATNEWTVSAVSGDVPVVQGVDVTDVGTIDVKGGAGKDTLIITETNLAAFTGTISNFSIGDVIDLAGVSATFASVDANNVLNVTTANGNVALQLDSALINQAMGFVTSSDGNGGSNITFENKEGYYIPQPGDTWYTVTAAAVGATGDDIFPDLIIRMNKAMGGGLDKGITYIPDAISGAIFTVGFAAIAGEGDYVYDVTNNWIMRTGTKLGEQEGALFWLDKAGGSVEFAPGTWEGISVDTTSGGGTTGTINFTNPSGSNIGTLTLNGDNGNNVLTLPDGTIIDYPPGGEIDVSIDVSVVGGVITIADSFPNGDVWTQHIGPTGTLQDSTVTGPGIFPYGPSVIPEYARAVASLFNQSITDPIVLDLSGNNSGVQLTSLANSNAHFDLHGDGFAVHTGWVGPTTGILVNTTNPTSISNVFGSSSVDGFTALQSVDSNHDGVINSSDSGFSGLYVWEDTNGNGVADAGEVHSLSDLGITSINLNSSVVNQNVNGNVIGSVATFNYSSGASGEVAEAFFDNSQLDSTYTGSYTLNPEVLLLPNLRGYGTLPDLYIAMSLDSTLLGMVQNLANDPLSDASTYNTQVQAIIYQWAGVNSIDPTSNAYMDAQHLAVIQAVVGESYTLANGHQGQVLEGAYQEYFSAVEQRLLMQGPLADLFPNVTYNYNTDSMVGTIDFAAAATAIGADAPTDVTAAAQYWINLAPAITFIANNMATPCTPFIDALRSALDAAGISYSDGSLTSQGIFIGGSSDDTLTATGAGDYLDGGAGNNVLHGVGGGTLVGGTGNNTFYGLADDKMYGGSGNDTVYVRNVSAGMIVDGGSGNNTLDAGTDITALSIKNVQTLDVEGSVALTAAQLDEFTTIDNAYGTGSTATITAANAGTYDLNAVTAVGDFNLSVANTGDNVTLIGNNQDGQILSNGGTGTDTITAGNGVGDILNATGSGNVVLTGGNGGDTFNLDSYGAVTATGGTGDDTFKVYSYAPSTMTITGGGGNDTLIASGNLTSLTINNVQTLDLNGDATLTAAQLAGFTTIDNTFGAGTLTAAVGGTYDLSAITTTGDFNLSTGNVSDNVTLIGNNQDHQRLISSGSGTNILTAGNGVGDILNASGTGNVTMTGGNGGDTFNVSSSGGVVTAISGNGGDTFNLNSAASITATGGTGNDTFNVSSYNPTTMTINGGGGNNVLVAAGNITALAISNVQTFEIVDSTTLTAAQMAGFTTIDNVYGTGYTLTLTAATGGTYDLTAPGIEGAFNLRVGNTSDDVTLIGNNQANQILTSGGTGTDTLIAGNGSGDILNAYGSDNVIMIGGSGSDTFNLNTSGTVTVTGGTGNDTFNVSSYNPSAMTINGGGGNDVLVAAGNITSLTINDVQTFEMVDSTKLTAAQMAGFTTIDNVYGTGYTLTLTAASGGTYDLTAPGIEGSFNLNVANTSDDVTLIGNNQNSQVLTNGGTGTDTLIAGNGTGDVLNANGSGNVIMTGGNGGDTFNLSTSGTVTATGGTGNDTFNVSSYNPSAMTITGDGGNDTLVAAGNITSLTLSDVQTFEVVDSTKLTAAQMAGFTTIENPYGSGYTPTLTAASGGTYDLNAETIIGNFNMNVANTSDDVTLIGNEQNYQTLSNGGTGTDTLTAGNGTGDILNANGGGNAVLTGGNGGDTFNLNSYGTVTATGGTGNDTFNINSNAAVTINGGGGSDQYNFANNLGQTTINNGTGSTASGAINLGWNVSDENLWFTQSGNDLEIDKLGTTSEVTIANWFGSDAGAQVTSISASGLQIDSQINQLVSAMATYAANNSGFNPATTSMPTDSTLQSAIAAAWHS